MNKLIQILNRVILTQKDREDLAKIIELADESKIIGNLNNLHTEDKSNIVSAINEAVDNSGGEALVPITYVELKALRDNSKLIPGQQYRITDYECTTCQPDTRAVHHPFDIIVTANSVNSLDENARACRSAVEDYNPEAAYISRFVNGVEVRFRYIGKWFVNADISVGQNFTFLYLWQAECDSDLFGASMPVLISNKSFDEIMQSGDDACFLKCGILDSNPSEMSYIFDTTNLTVLPVDFTDFSLSPSQDENYITHYDAGKYFASNNPESWKLKYCLDNDIERFRWACNGQCNHIKVKLDDDGENFDDFYLNGNKSLFTEMTVGKGKEVNYFSSFPTQDITVIYPLNDIYNIKVGDLMYPDRSCIGETICIVDEVDYAPIGKGVIYWMKDANGNECDYDFMNIQIKYNEITYSGMASQTPVETWNYTFGNELRNWNVKSESFDKSYNFYNVKLRSSSRLCKATLGTYDTYMEPDISYYSISCKGLVIPLVHICGFSEGELVITNTLCSKITNGYGNKNNKSTINNVIGSELTVNYFGIFVNIANCRTYIDVSDEPSFENTIIEYSIIPEENYSFVTNELGSFDDLIEKNLLATEETTD